MFWWSRRHSERTVARIEAAFPHHLSGDVRAVLQIVPKAEHAQTPDDVINVSVQSEPVRIPYRVYFPEPEAKVVTALSAQQRLVLAAIITRHHDGFARERWLSEDGFVCRPLGSAIRRATAR
jgi:virulence-associated protein VagC